MSNFFVVPLSPEPQTFGISLGGVNYTLTIKWCDALEGGWVMDIADALTNTSIVAGIPLTTGSNLLEGLDYLGIGGELWVYTDGNPDAVPTFENLGINSNLYFVTV